MMNMERKSLRADGFQVELSVNPTAQVLFAEHTFLVRRGLMRDIWTPMDGVDSAIWG